MYSVQTFIRAVLVTITTSTAIGPAAAFQPVELALTNVAKDRAVNHSQTHRPVNFSPQSPAATAPAKPQWTIVSAIVQRYTAADRVDGADPVVQDGTAGLRILMTVKYDGPDKTIPPGLRVVALPAETPLHVPGNLAMGGMGDFDALELFLPGLSGSTEPTPVTPGRVYGEKAPMRYFAVDVPLEVSQIRITFGDSRPRAVKIAPSPRKP